MQYITLWMKHGSTTSKNGLKLRKTQQSVGKVIAPVFWDAHKSN